MSAFAPVKRRFAALRERIHTATPRERLMLAALSCVFLLIVISVGLKKCRTENKERKNLAQIGEGNQIALELAPATDAALKAKSEKLRGKRLSATDFLAAVDTLARESGLNAETSTPRTEKSRGLTIHRMKVNLRAASLRKLMDFDDRLRLKGDGYVVERVEINARSDSGELAATYELATCQPSE